MSDIGQFPPGHGYAWRGDWRRRLSELVQARGHSSASEFVDAHPSRSLIELAAELGGGDVAAVQLETVLLDDARTTGTVERRARDFLARRLAALPDGWPGPAAIRTREQESRAMSALSGWVPQTLPGLTTEHIVAIAAALLRSAELPAGWRPTGPDDPVIVDVFAQHWPKAK